MDHKDQEGSSRRKEQLKAVARYSGLGMEMAGAVMGTALLGRWLDDRYGLEQPVCTLLLSFIGVLYVFYRIFRIASKPE